MSPSPAAAFEVLRFTGQPVTAEAALVELEGRFPDGPPRRRAPRLHVEGSAVEPVECSPAVQAALGDGTWRASYAIPLALLDRGAYALAVDDLLLELPRPDVETSDGGDPDRLVRLAREANELRRRLDAARTGRAEAEARAERAEAGLSLERAERAAAEQSRDAEAATVAALRAELEGDRERFQTTEAGLREELQADRERAEATGAGLREELAAAQRAAGEREAELVAERERMLDAERVERSLAVDRERTQAARELDEAVSAERARAGQVARELRAARAELESLRRAAPAPRSGRFTGGGSTDAEPAATAEAADTEPDAPAPADAAPDTTEAEPATARFPRAAPDVPDTGDTAPIAARRRWTGARGKAAAAEDPTVRVARRTALWTGEDETPAHVDGDEGVRVLARSPRRRHRAEDEPEDVAPAPGAAAAGARQFEPASTSQELPIARILAVGALALAVLVVLALIVGKL